MLVRSHFLFESGILLSLQLHLEVKTEWDETKFEFYCMLEYFLSPAKADLLLTYGGSSARSDPLVTGLMFQYVTVRLSSFQLLCSPHHASFLDNLLSVRSLQASRWYCNESGRHFRIYILESWTDLDKTWRRDGKWGKSDPVKFLTRSLQKPQRKGQNTTHPFGHFRFTDFRETLQE